MIYVILYLIAIVLANLVVTTFGPSAAIVTAFVFIGLDLTARDKLHEAWHGRSLIPKMGLLIIAGSVLSWLVNRDAAQIAVASAIAFFVAALVDTIAYQLLIKRGKLVKINGSNVFSSLADSIAFPTIAFGVFMPGIIAGQFLAKMLGGFIWSVILVRINNNDYERATQV